jgi:hypothetical protein
VAALCRATMKQQLDNGVGKKSFRDYIIVIDKYLTKDDGQPKKSDQSHPQGRWQPAMESQH